MLDTSGRRVANWFVVYYRRPDVLNWWSKYLHRDFRHVELWRPTQFGPSVEDTYWTVMRPTFEMLEAETTLDPTPPWVKYPDCTHAQNVTATRLEKSSRDYFFAGPQTCVEYVKAALGVRHFWIRTPYQLYKFIASRDCVITN